MKLPQKQEKKAVQYWTQHLHELNINDAKLGGKKDLFYDFLLHTPIILVALQEAAKQINNKELLAVIPESAAELFMFLTKYPAAIVDIQSDGSMLADKTKSNDFLLNAPAEEVRRFLEADMSQSKIDAFLAKRQTPKKTKRSTKSGKNVDRHVQDTYRSMIQTNTLMMFPNSWL